MRQGLLLFCAALLVACASHRAGVVRPIVVDGSGVPQAVSAAAVEERITGAEVIAPDLVPGEPPEGPVVTASAPQPVLPPPRPARVRILTGGSQEIPRIDCRTTLSKDDDMTRSLIEERVREGSYYAALAQIQALPAKVASVAILRADILRRLGAPEAEDWYRAMQDTCVSAQAEHGLGLLAAGRQDYVLARKHLMEAVERQPAMSSMRNDLGFVYLNLGQDRQAEFELRTAHELAPDDRQPALNLALLALLRGDTGDWWRWRERLKLTDGDRSSLDRSCRQLSLVWAEMRAKAAGGSGTSAMACPINPAL